MEDALAPYEKPYRSAEPVMCTDEKPGSLHASVRPNHPAQQFAWTIRDLAAAYPFASTIHPLP